MSAPLSLSTNQVFLLLLTTVPGIAGVVIFGFFTWRDWLSLRTDYSYFVALIEQRETLEALFVAEAQQNVHRLNFICNGTWTLLSAILAAIGLHGVWQRRY